VYFTATGTTLYYRCRGGWPLGRAVSAARRALEAAGYDDKSIRYILFSIYTPFELSPEPFQQARAPSFLTIVHVATWGSVRRRP